MSHRLSSPRPLAALAVCAGVVSCLAAPVYASVSPEVSTVMADKQFRHADLYIDNAYRHPSELPAPAAAAIAGDLSRLGLRPDQVRLDVRSARWGTLMPDAPLLPGDGVGNRLLWSDFGIVEPESDEALRAAALDAFLGWVTVNSSALRIDPDELSADATVSVQRDGTLIQFHVPREVGGVAVRGSYLLGVVSHGNLVLFGAELWGDVTVPSRPALTPEAAADLTRTYLDPAAVDGRWAEPELLFVPFARGTDPATVPVGEGYDYRLAWAVRPQVAGEMGRWELLWDARSGELLSSLDTNHYQSLRQVQGGVFPVSNDGTPPDGVEQSGWPMPFDNVSTPSGVQTTDSGGNLSGCITGNITSNLDGQFVRMNDTCGAISLTSSGDIDFGTSGGTNCTTPGFGGAGNTHSSRTGFYELNRIIEQARAQLPGNLWLQSQLTANMNLNNTCNAFWNGVTVNFYREGGGCANTGELAGVFDHEWGHGIDDNDANPSVSNPGEGIADLYAGLRLNTSCIGRGVLQGSNCGGYGDPCTNCDGVRDIDFANRASGNPHDVAWIDANCPVSFSNGPCGGAVHCEGAVYSEAVWDLYTRDLPAAPFNQNSNTALELTTYLNYQGAGNVGTWFQCTTPFGGCNASGGYLNYLAADDDNGSLGDGTPHMSAIFAAFDRHGVACNTPAVVNSGCGGTPTTAPSVTATPGDKTATLSWSAVGGASSYEIYRADGVFACNFGKIKVGTTAATSFTDSGLQNGRAYSYTVIPKGPGASCFGPASACDTVTPVAGPSVCTPGGGIEYGTDTFDEIIRTVGVSGFTDPIVVMGPPSFNGNHPSTVRVRNVTSSSFDHNLQEWDYLDGNHVDETIGFLVLESGTSTVGGLQAEAGTVNLQTSFVTVNFSSAFSTPPVVLAQVATFNGPQAVTTRVRNVTTTGFQVKLREEEANDNFHNTEVVHWIAIEPGTTTVNGDTLVAGITGNSVTHNWFTINFGTSLTDPVFLAEMNTNDGNDTAALRHRNLGASSVQVKVEEEQSANSETNHITEVVGWVAIEE